MDSSISATEANRSFARLLRRVRAGERVRITSHSRVVAIMTPPETDETAIQQRQEAAEALEQRWATQESRTVGPWTREELYDRESWNKWQR